MPLLFSHPTGNANVRGALAGLFDAGLLGEFHTSIPVMAGTVSAKLRSAASFSAANLMRV